MAKPWAEVQSSEQYQALPPQAQEAARQQYFNDVVAPQVPAASLDVAKQQFEVSTAPQQQNDSVQSATNSVPPPAIAAASVAPQTEPDSFSKLIDDMMKSPLESSESLNKLVGPFDYNHTIDNHESRFYDAQAPINPNGVVSANGAHYGRMTPKEDQPGADALHKTVRQGGLIGRAALEGVPALGLMAGDLAMGPYIRAENEAGREQISPSEAYSQLLTEAGAPEPKTAGEKLESAAVKGAASAIGSMGVGALSDVPAVKTLLTADPVLQTISSVAGSTAAEQAAQSGASPKQQMAAGIIASLLPGAARYGIPEATKSLLSGGEKGRAVAQDAIDSFEQAGTVPTVAQATGSRTWQAAENLLSKAPGGAGPMANKSVELQADLANKIDNMAESLAPKATPEQAGRAIYKGITGDSSMRPQEAFIPRARAVQKTLYDKLDEFLPANSDVSVANTKAALEKLTAPIAGAENLSATPLFQNGSLNQTKDALAADLGETGAKFIKDPAGKATYSTIPVDNIQGRYVRDPAGPVTYKTVQGGEESTGNSLTVPLKEPAAPTVTTSGMRYVETNNPISENGNSSGMRYITPGGNPGDGVRSSFAPTTTIPYQALKALRTRIGEKLSDIDLAPDVSKRELKTLYGALSSDMEQAAKDAGDDAYKAYQRANGYTSAMHDRIDMLQSVIDKNGGPEKIFSAATSGTKDGATVLHAVMQSLPQDGQKMLSASILRRMGRALPGAQNETGDIFSTERFLTSWNTMSPEAKQVAFGRYGGEFNKNMDAIASVAANLRAGSKVFANPSGSAQVISQQATIMTILAALGTGHVGTAALATGGVGAANLAARAFTSPRVVRWMATQTKKPIGSLPAAINTLATDAKKSKDPDAMAVAAQLQQGIDDQANQ